MSYNRLLFSRRALLPVRAAAGCVNSQSGIHSGQALATYGSEDWGVTVSQSVTVRSVRHKKHPDWLIRSPLRKQSEFFTVITLSNWSNLCSIILKSRVTSASQQTNSDVKFSDVKLFQMSKSKIPAGVGCQFFFSRLEVRVFCSKFCASQASS